MVGEKINIRRIKEERVAKGFSISEMSEALGYQSYVAYYRKEEGQRRFSTNDVAKIAEKLDLDLDKIFLDDKLTNR
ncbi:helix-turn-helix domain-containing protein [Salinicoccus albus]|uniref:helix-turn-helix domain-containing protein n=1 Tax=Salinicoccus albus TaxID=418756 RepID=UPI000372E3DC|nr:helix-turn-helix transcriptional regulator [Salinicoccus albus]